MRIFITVFLIALAGSAQAQPVDSLQYVLGRFDYIKHADFVKIPSAYANKEEMYLRKEALDAFKLMRQAAVKDGVNLTIISATRNFDHQKRIWEAKWNGQRLVNGQNLRTTIPDEAARTKEILKYSSMPGTSRHHWGTDIDINSLSSNYFQSGKGKKEYEWLRDHAYEFGFCQVYSQKGTDRPNGYEEEEWHWSYIPLARTFLRYHQKHVTAKQITDFDGSDALPLSEISKYVNGIAPECK
ncbi:MAG: D-alanyl-D-alanine carboxypeptidase family protein [Flavobacteriales bacterium]|nr:D-alanyl-D-alanine carboxypeptidase family protein [Flavobacteriales bacterium]